MDALPADFGLVGDDADDRVQYLYQHGNPNLSAWVERNARANVRSEAIMYIIDLATQAYSLGLTPEKVRNVIIDAQLKKGKGYY
jgi:hypothetical protein